MKIQNKRIVITGASSGIGFELVQKLSSFEGTKIIASGRNIEKIPLAKNIIGYKADISNQYETDKLFDFAIEKMGGIDIFIANAGFGYYERFRNKGWEHIDEIFKTNVISPLYSLGKMAELNSSKEFSVVITCSAIGKIPYPGMALYTASKFALDGFNSAYQSEIPQNGHLVMVYPVATYTRFFENANMKGKDMPRPRQHVSNVVKSIINGIEKNKKHVYPYRPISFLVWFTNLLPFTLNLFMSISAKKIDKIY